MAGAGGTWRPVGVDSDLERGPSGVPLVAHQGHLDLLPLHVLPWPAFESLQWRILRDVEGLRHAQIYGDLGQAQQGLDLIAVAADESGVALQSKRVKQFGPAKVDAAVDAFRDTQRPFDVSRFILGVSMEVRRTQTLDRFKEFQKQFKQQLKPIEFELWDKRELSAKLKGAPQIVIDYFGQDVAKIFCDPFTIRERVVPTREAVAIREAIARTPEVAMGAGAKIAEAEALAETDPTAALALVAKAQAALVERGFSGHAAQHESLRASLLVAVGRGSEATAWRLEQLWVALDHGQLTTADMARHDISTLAERVGKKAAREHRDVADRALYLYSNPLASVPDLTDLLVGEVRDRAQLAALAGETALSAGDHAWLKRSAIKLRNLATKLSVAEDTEALQVRLRILAAEGSGKWAPILGDARSLRMGYDLCALVQARYARHLALRQKFAEADASWDEAAGNACLAQRWTDASRWIFSRRAFSVRWKPFTANELLPIQTALAANGPDATVLSRDEDALEYAYSRLADDKLRPAAIAAQRALRDAVTLGDWEGERRARRLLADILTASGEHLMAASHLVLVGDVTALKRLAADHTTQFLDVTPHLNATSWWIAGAAYRLIAAQSDLVPDALVPVVAGAVVDVLESAQKNTLVDLPSFAGSRYLSAIAALAGIAERLTYKQAETALTHFEAQPAVDPSHYRFHDGDEAKIAAGILTTHPELSEQALAHLVQLLSRSEVSRNNKTHDAITDRLPQAQPLLKELAEAGNRWARELLQGEHPESASSTQIQEARSRLEEPLVHTPGVYPVGGGSASLPDSALVRTLPMRDQQAALEQLLARGADTYVSAVDRASYLVAASNLRPPNDRTRRTKFLEQALTLVLSPPESLADAFDAPYRNPLGAVQMNRKRDTRGEAVHLAATLARTRQEKERVRTAVLGLIGDDTVSELWATRALQRLGETMAPDVGFLSGQNWALRSLAAILWSKTTAPTPVGYRLAADPDVRVRRALALHLVQAETGADGDAQAGSGGAGAAGRRDTRSEVVRLLLEDPCFSVRVAAGAASNASPTANHQVRGPDRSLSRKANGSRHERDGLGARHAAK